MRVFDLLRVCVADLHPRDCKVHLASGPPGAEHPLDAFLAGTFVAWQADQSQRNFRLPFIVALIQLPETDRWLFGGLHQVTAHHRKDDGRWHYDTLEHPGTAALTGRLVVRYHRSGRASYPYAEPIADQLAVAAVRDARMRVADFPGFQRVHLSWEHLRLVVRQAQPSWQSALSAVSGVYVITDASNGRQYVGSATGGAGLWGRWCAYASDGHGGNRDLKRVLAAEGASHARHFRYAVLEIADTHTDADAVLAREAHWKRVLGSREFGYNAN
jgi:hypothetical protein